MGFACRRGAPVCMVQAWAGGQLLLRTFLQKSAGAARARSARSGEAWLKGLDLMAVLPPLF